MFFKYSANKVKRHGGFRAFYTHSIKVKEAKQRLPDRFVVMHKTRSWAHQVLYLIVILLLAADVLLMFTDIFVTAVICIVAASTLMKILFFRLRASRRAFARDFFRATLRIREEFGVPARTLTLSYYLRATDLREASEKMVRKAEKELREHRRHARRLADLEHQQASLTQFFAELNRDLADVWVLLSVRERRRFQARFTAAISYDEMRRIAVEVRQTVQRRERGVKILKGDRRETEPEADTVLLADSEVPKTLPEEVHVRLPEIERAWDIDALLPDGVDQPMAKAIILELMDVGSRKTAFGESYRAEDTLRRMVYRRYGRAPFKPRVFTRTLKALRTAGVVQSKPKTNEEVFSLTPRPAAGEDARASELIREVVRFYSRHSSPG